MENELQQYRPQTLMSDLASWNRQENKFRELFSPDALKDREFLKMKLEHYDQLYYKYGGKPQTQDEQAMMTILRFQRRKMEKALYPGLLRRLLHRGATRLIAVWSGNRENVTINRDQANRKMYDLPPIVSRENGTDQQSATVRKMPVPKYGQQHRMKQHRKKGPSL